jgi:prepilin-type N-terminal cleavage/methylation domain-containing protein
MEKFRNAECVARSDFGGKRARRSFFRTPRSLLRNSPAFTLIEVMIAITIFSMVIAAIYSTWSLIVRATVVGKEAAAQVQRQRIAIQTVEDALTGIQSFQASPQYYSFIVQNGQSPMLCFTARLPDDFPRNGKFGDFNVRRLLFTVESEANPTKTGQENDLVLRQWPILMSMDPDEQQTPFVLARNVKTFAVDCWGTNSMNEMDWVDEWDDTNSIPQLIRVTLILGGNRTDNFGNTGPTWGVSRIISVPSQMMPASLQTGGGPLGGNSPPGAGPQIPISLPVR